MFLTICLSSTIQKTVSFADFSLAQVNRSISYRLDASGKAVNTARVLNQLKKDCVVSVCPVGVENADLFKKLADIDGLKIRKIPVPGFTRECITAVDVKNHTTTEIVVDEPPLKIDINRSERKLLKAIDEELSSVKAVVLSGSRPAIWNEDLQVRICKKCLDFAANKAKQKSQSEADRKNERNSPILLVDFCGKDLIRTLEVCIPDIIKINEDEFCATFGVKLNLSEDELSNEILKINRRYKNILIITRGTEPTLAAQNEKIFSSQTQKITPVNTTACGDSFNAGFIFEYLKTGDLQFALDFGTDCATKNALSLVPGSIIV